jgi:hypothetical protein
MRRRCRRRTISMRPGILGDPTGRQYADLPLPTDSTSNALCQSSIGRRGIIV